MPIEPWWETNSATTPRQELGMVSPELQLSRHGHRKFGLFGDAVILQRREDQSLDYGRRDILDLLVIDRGVFEVLGPL